MFRQQLTCPDLLAVVTDRVVLAQACCKEFWKTGRVVSLFTPPETSNPPGCAVLMGSVEGVVEDNSTAY